jgi:DNA-binding NarL/FixJ family response regulator
MSSNRNQKPVRIGILIGEPIRLAGMSRVFEDYPVQGSVQLVPVVGNLDELLAPDGPDFLIIDLNSTSEGLDVLGMVRRRKPAVRLIVIGPDGDEELVMQTIMSGARAYLDMYAGPQTVRQAVEVVTNGSIWAPRRILSKLVDRLLNVPEAVQSATSPHLTVREAEVLDMILLAQSNREIAHHLGIEERTVKAHVGRLMRKTGAENRIELSVRALNHTLLPGAAGRHVSSVTN